MNSPRAVGIDLGTTYSAIAWINDSGRSAVVPNAEGDLLTPSLVFFDDDEILVGKEAKKLAYIEADRVVDCVKRHMGKPFYGRPIGGRHLPPEVISAMILKKLRHDLTRVAGEQVKAVVTVPAFFDEPRRKATMDAATMAGIDVLDIVNEPTAAALAFGEEQGYLSATGMGDRPPDANEQQPMTIAVYDLGGGTFDVTLLELKSGNLRTLATDGDVKLGGRDWDQVLVDRAAERFLREHGLDPREDATLLQRLFTSVEEAKHTLSVRQSATVRVAAGGHTLDIRITREEFEDATGHLLERTAYVMRQLLTAAGMQWSDISRILLVGGSTRMPMVAQMLRDRTGLQPDHSVNPDEAVARGAALYARHLLDSAADGVTAGFQVTNVNSHSLGVEGVDPRTGRRCNNIIIPRNSALPARKTEKFATRQTGQSSVVVKVLEGESPVPAECTPIGRTVIRNLPTDLPAGTPIRVTYEYGTNGRLSVLAMVAGTDREVQLELERDGSLSPDLVHQWQGLVAAGGGLLALEQLLPSPAEVAGKRPSAVTKIAAGRRTDVGLQTTNPSGSGPSQARPSQPSGTKYDRRTNQERPTPAAESAPPAAAVEVSSLDLHLPPRVDATPVPVTESPSSMSAAAGPFEPSSLGPQPVAPAVAPPDAMDQGYAEASPVAEADEVEPGSAEETATQSSNDWTLQLWMLPVVIAVILLGVLIVLQWR